MVGHWIAFALIIPLIPFSLVFSFVKFGKLNEQNEKEKQRIYATIVKTSLYFWLLDLFYMSCFTNWTLGKYLFGISTILFVFVNLTSAFLAKTNGNKWGLLLDFLVGIGLSTYLIYIITDATLQTVVLAIVAAVYGGLLTLVGVAWTIQDNADKLKEERKLSIKPYLDIHHVHFSTLEELPCKDALFVEIGDYITFSNTIPNRIKHLITPPKEDKTGIETAAHTVFLADFMSSHYLMSCTIENCGAGNAINLKIKINDFEITPMCVTTSAAKVVVFIISDKLLSEEVTEYLISISYTYSDISNFGKYQQKESFIFTKNKYDELQLVQFKENFLTAPEEL